jgi:hypothetical protein
VGEKASQKLRASVRFAEKALRRPMRPFVVQQFETLVSEYQWLNN